VASTANPPTTPPEEPELAQLRLAQAALVLVVALTLNLAGNSRVGLWDRDEPRYATCTREMRESGDWIHPTFNAEPRYHKPILIYWLMLAGTALGGDNPFGARLISSLAGAATCVLVWAWGRRMFGPKIGVLAGLILATAPIMVAESKLATTDATLTFFLVGCQFALWELSHRDSPRAAAAFWICLALSMLTKGPVGLALVGMASLFGRFCGASPVSWKRLHWRVGLLGFALITAPWFIAIAFVSKGEFYRVAVGFHIVQRVAAELEEHGAFVGYYPLTTLGVFYPWSALLPTALAMAWSKRKENPDFAYLLGWVVGPLVLLECVRTKLVHYYLPAYPACALLGAWLIFALSKSDVNLRRWPLGRLSVGLLIGVGIGLTVALLAGGVVFPAPLRWPSLAIALVLGIGALSAMEAFQRNRPIRAALGLIASTGLTMWIVSGWLLPASEPYRTSKTVGIRLGELVDATGATPMLGQFQEPGIIYALGCPAANMQSRDSLAEQVYKAGLIASALTPAEIKALQADPRFALEIRATLDGFNLSKGRNETLHMVLIRPSELARKVYNLPEPKFIDRTRIRL
jgi:4-amino-4-deoxy-L-arabinose transferase-like glycosyltransferase